MSLSIALLAFLPLQGSPPDLARTLEPALEELIAEHRLPGLAIGVVKDGKVIYARGFGELSRGSGKPITTRGYSWDYVPAWDHCKELEQRFNVPVSVTVEPRSKSWSFSPMCTRAGTLRPLSKPSGIS